MTLERKTPGIELAKKDESYVTQGKNLFSRFFTRAAPVQKISAPVEAKRPTARTFTEEHSGTGLRCLIKAFSSSLDKTSFLPEEEWNNLVDSLGGYEILEKAFFDATLHLSNLNDDQGEQLVKLAYLFFLNIVNLPDLKITRKMINLLQLTLAGTEYLEPVISKESKIKLDSLNYYHRRPKEEAAFESKMGLI